MVETADDDESQDGRASAGMEIRQWECVRRIATIENIELPHSTIVIHSACERVIAAQILGIVKLEHPFNHTFLA